MLFRSPPNNVKDLRSILGIFGYYKDWIEDFEAKVLPLDLVERFPIHGRALKAFYILKKDLQHITLSSLDDSAPFVVETDASGVALSAILNKFGKPYAYFSQKLTGKDLNLAAPEKEAMAILKAVLHWRLILLGRKFTILTDQRSTSSILDRKSVV